MRILYINSSVGWGGMEMHPLEVASALAARGHHIAFCVKKGTRMGTCRGSFGPVRHHDMPFFWYVDPATYVGLRKLAHGIKPDVIHVHHARDTWIALLMVGITRKKTLFVFTKHIASPEGKRKIDPLHSLLVRRLDALVAISAYMQKNILNVYPIEASKVPIIYYGIGSSAIGRPEMGRTLRKRLGVAHDQPLVGMVAQVTPDKRQDLFVRAAATVVRQIPSCTCIIAGGVVQQSYYTNVRMLISELGLTDAVRYVGFVEDVPSLMQALDIIVLPSKAEAFGLVLLEAMANGRPVVASDSGAAPEIVRDGSNGYLFRTGDADELAARLCDLLRDHDKRDRFGNEGKRMFEERFRLEREVAETTELYESLLARM